MNSIKSKTFSLVIIIVIITTVIPLILSTNNDTDYHVDHIDNNGTLQQHQPHDNHSTTTAAEAATAKNSAVTPSIIINTERSNHNLTDSNYKKLQLWIRKFYQRFPKLFDYCSRNQSCKCMDNVDDLLRKTSSSKTEPINQLTINVRRIIATLLVANVINLDRQQQLLRQSDKWPIRINNDSLLQKCQTLAEQSICLNGESTSEGYYQENREHLLKSLMPNFLSQFVDTHEDNDDGNNHDDDDDEDDDSHNHSSSIMNINSSEFAANLDQLLQNLDDNLLRSKSSKSSLFDRETIVKDLNRLLMKNSNLQHDPYALIETLSLLLVNRLVKGENIESIDRKYLRFIIEKYGHNHKQDQEQTMIDKYGLAKLLNDLHIGGFIDHRQPRSLNHRHGHDHDDHHDDDHTKKYLEHHNHLVKYLSDDHDHRSDKNLATDCYDFDYYIRLLRQNSSNSVDGTVHISSKELKQLLPIFLQQILSKSCEKFNDNDIVNGEQLIHSESSHHIGHNHDHDHHGHHDHQHHHNHNATNVDFGVALIYGNLSILVISLSSLGGILLIPILKSRAYVLTIQMLIGLAFSSMSGDALFHLIPSVLGIHSHSNDKEDDNGKHHHDDATHFEYLWFMITISISIYLLFLFELISNALAKLKDGQYSGHSHNHNLKYPSNNDDDNQHHQHQHYPHHHHQQEHHHDHQHGHFTMNFNKQQQQQSNQPTNTDHSKDSPLSLQSATISPSSATEISDNSPIRNVHDTISSNNLSLLSKSTSNSNSTLINDRLSLSSSTLSSKTKLNHNNDSKNNDDDNNNKIICLGMSSLALIITLSDSIHNLIDGIAIGISYSNSIANGLSTTIAVFCHELPHEFGDFAVMISTGMSVKRAAIINFLSALTSFIGLYIGLLLGNSEQANRYSLAICSGLFLYISLCDMLPELKEMVEPIFSKQWWLSFVMKNIGIIFGYIFMIFIAIYEDKINFA